MNNKNASYIFDVDGTLVDSYPVIVSCAKEVLDDLGVNYTADYIREYVIRYSVRKLMTEVTSDLGLDMDPIMETLDELNSSRLSLVKAMPKAKEMLTLLTEAGHKCYIYTHRGKSCSPILKQTGLNPFFEEVVTAGYGFLRKPEPDGIRYLVDKYNMDPDCSFYVGDRIMDIEAADRAGIRSILYLSPDSPIKPSGKETFVVSDLSVIARMT